jgi:hypothetical protein
MGGRENLGPQFLDLYHATEHEMVPEIKKRGLRHNDLHDSEGEENWTASGPGPFAAHDYGEAVLDQGEGYSLVHMRIPHPEVDTYLTRGAHVEEDNSHLYALRRSIPAKYVHKVTKHEGDW